MHYRKIYEQFYGVKIPKGFHKKKLTNTPNPAIIGAL